MSWRLFVDFGRVWGESFGSQQRKVNWVNPLPCTVNIIILFFNNMLIILEGDSTAVIFLVSMRHSTTSSVHFHLIFPIKSCLLGSIQSKTVLFLINSRLSLPSLPCRHCATIQLIFGRNNNGLLSLSILPLCLLLVHPINNLQKSIW